jgi:Short C-terminal domain
MQPQPVAPRSSMPSAEPASEPKDTGQQLELLTQLGELRNAGVLTEDEFARKKAEILG